MPHVIWQNLMMIAYRSAGSTIRISLSQEFDGLPQTDRDFDGNENLKGACHEWYDEKEHNLRHPRISFCERWRQRIRNGVRVDMVPIAIDFDSQGGENGCNSEDNDYAESHHFFTL